MALDAESSAVRAATPADDAGLHTLWAAAFDAPLMVPLWSLDPLRHERTLVVVEPDGTVAASVVSLPRLVRADDGTVHRVAGVANVATLPTARGKGYAKRLLAELVARAGQDGFDWALLFTGTPGVYEGSGWTTFAQQHRTGTLRATQQRGTERDLGTGARAGRPSDPGTPAITCYDSTPQTWQALAPLHEAATSAHPLTTLRDDLSLRRTALWHAAATLLVAEAPSVPRGPGPSAAAPSHPVGYVVVDTSQTARVVELAADTEDIARLLLDAAADRASADGHRRLTLRLPDSSTLARLAADLLDDIEWTQDLTGMTYPLLAGPGRTRAIVEHPLAHHSTGDYL